MKQTIAVIDFGTSKIVTLIAEGDGFKAPEILGTGTVPYDGFMDGHWNAPDVVIDESIRRSIAEAESQAGQKLGKVNVGVPGDFVRIEIRQAETELPAGHRVTPQDVDELFARTLEPDSDAGRVVAHNPAWFEVDGKRSMEPVGMKGAKLSCKAAMVIADMAFVEDVTDRIEALGLQVGDFYSSSAAEMMASISTEERDRGAIMVDVGYLSTEVMAMEGDALVYHEMLPVGGGHFTADIAYGLNLTMYIAEQVKRRYAFGADIPVGTIEAQDEKGVSLTFTREQVQEIVEPRMEELAEMIGSAIERIPLLLQTRTTCYLTGGGLSMMRGGRESLATALGRPVKVPQLMLGNQYNPTFNASLSLLEVVFEILADEADGDDAKGVSGFFKKLFTK